jgi:hypothetical protein
VDFDVTQFLPRVKAIGRKSVSGNIVDNSDTIKLTDETLAERPATNGEARKVQAVDMVFIGSESGQLELRFLSYRR